MRFLACTLLSLFCASVALAQDPPPRISDEGGSKSVYFNLDCTGAGVTCSTSGINATINVPGGGSATFTVEEDNASVDAAVTNLDFLSCFDITSSPAGEANVAFDSGECTVNADALKANGANCAANSFPLGVDASGAVESCSTSISGNAATATALAANGANCSAGSGAGGVDASGASEDCTDYYSTLAELQTSVTNDFHNLGGTDDDVPESGDFTNLTDGTNLTFSPAGTLNVDNPVVANLTGNASTATALAANGANCSASSFPLGVDASGAVESCSTSISGNAATVTFADAGGDTTTFPALGTAATGSLAPATDAELTYNATTNNLSTTIFTGALSGNASTATALAANGANCSANSYPLGVDASGAAESCGTNISGNAGTATALAANGANCSAGNYPLGVDASGAVETCTADDDVPESGDLAAATLQVVTTSGKTTDVGMTLLDDTNIDFGTSSDISCEYASATEDLECRNTLSDFGVNLDLDFPVDIATTSTTTSGVDQYSALKLSNTVNGYAALTQDYGIDLDVNFDDTTNLNLSGFATALRSEMNISSTGGFPTSASFANLVFSNNFTQPRTYGNTYGVFGTVNTQAAAVFSPSITAFTAGWDDSGGASTTSYYEFYARGISDLGGGPPVATNRYGLYVADGTGTPTLTNNYGVYISALTDGTNDYPLFLAGTAKQFFTDANVTINASSSGNLNLHASSDIDSDQTISFPDNEGTRFGAGNDASMYYDGTDLIVNPQLVGTGVVRIGPSGDEDLIGNRLNFCNTAIDTTAFVKGDCTGTARAALNFKLTKTGSNGTLGNTITMVNQTTAVSPNVTGLATTVTSDTTSETGGVYTGHKVIFGSLQDPAGAADMDFIGYQLVPSSFAAYTSDTVNQIGLHMDNLTLPSGASAGALYSGVFEEDLAFTSGRCIEFENSGDGAYTAGDSKFCHDSSDGDLEIFAENLQVADFDDDLTQFGDVVAGNYFQFYNAASGVIPEGSLKPVGNAIIAIDGDKPVFCYSGDVDACFYFSTTNAYEFRDLGGTSRFNLDVVNGDIEVGTASRGIDSVTAANDLTIGRVNAGDIAYGNVTNTPSHTFNTTDGASVVMDATIPLQVTQPTIGDQVTTLKSTATNDDPVEYVRQGRVTTTSTGATAILTITPNNNYTTTVDCTILARRTGGVSGAADDGAAYKRYATFKKNAGTVTQIGTTTATATHESVAGWDGTITVSGATVLVNGTGAATTDITWHATCRIYEVGS